ncbi:hypothetical protein K7472_11755 [Streptomyces sp. PTM05]|uniref:Uncharacterized protein n=1 Tax=Streptantibioticus parmotrematis TaxID=2873249 RepID=A0ABS7QQQ8_9ACTN|nr:hypothetical protein [Streptantibioticus parmotrematis]MBY8885522.1 hypothetical protein [Streptantibioticus parmotrematis]
MVLLSRGARRRATAERWDTWRPKARVLGVVRTLTSATRLLDVLTLLRPEDDVEVTYTVNPGSAFAAGLDEYLTAVGARVLPWREAVRQRFDLAVACTVNASMHRLRAPLMVLPHGAGYNRLVRETTGDAVSPAGLSRRELTRFGKVVPAVIGVSHEEQVQRLASVCPRAVPRAVVVGDWCFDRITASVPRRDEYRRSLGLRGDRKLVVLHSTWGEHSLIGSRPDLPLRLVTALPVDEYAVAAVLHPNVWARVGELGVRGRLADALDAGLMLVPAQEGWRAATIACDVVIGDHGSTTFYASSADRVTLLAATGLAELDPVSPAARFALRTPRLDPDGDLFEQVRQGIEHHKPDSAREITEAQLGAPGRAGEILRRNIYGFLAHRGVTVPDAPPRPRPVPAPWPVRQAVPVAYDVTGLRLDDGTVGVRRRPVAPEPPDEPRGFLAVTDLDTHPRRAHSAEVVARTVVDAELPPAEWLERKAAQLPGVDVLVAALGPDRCLLRLRDGTLLEARAAQALGAAHRVLDPVLLGCAVHLRRLADPAARAASYLTGEGLRVRTGERVLPVDFTEGPA